MEWVLFDLLQKLLGGIKNTKVKKPNKTYLQLIKPPCLVASYDKPGILRTYSNPDPHGEKKIDYKLKNR